MIIKKPKYIFFLLIFSLCTVVMAQETIDALKSSRWYLPSEFIAYLRFTEKSYDIIFSVGGYFTSGSYSCAGNEVTMFYPELHAPLSELSRNSLNWLFQGSTQTTFAYDPEYMDFDCVSCLSNDGRLLKSGNPSPYGQVYKLSGFDVIKYNKRESRVLILENLRMREYPDINAKIVTLSVYNMITNETTTGHIVQANTIHSFDAKTVKTDTIDGKTAHWYRLDIILDETFSKTVWVFGGYLKEV